MTEPTARLKLTLRTSASATQTSRSDIPAMRDRAEDRIRTASRAVACENGDGRGEAIASFLAPVLDHFDDVDAASLAAFTRKLVEGGRPRRGSQALVR